MYKSILITTLGTLLLSASSLAQPQKSTAYIPSNLPQNYEVFSACEKQSVIWQQIQNTEYKQMPEYEKFGVPQLVGLARQTLTTKGQNFSDFSPAGWQKFLHARAAVAKVRIVSRNNQYTGIFAGAECGILRLSLTYKPTDKRAVAPGLALKVLRDGARSANVSALVSLYGQQKNYNFFQYPMSNIVPIGNDFGQKLVHRIFRRVSRFPEELLISDMAAVDAKGITVANRVSPRQIFFVPSENLKFSSAEHDVRNDFSSITPETLLYRIYAVSDSKREFDYVSNYSAEQVPAFLKDSVHIADVVTTSEFRASEFGDNGLFFRHQFRY